MRIFLCLKLAGKIFLFKITKTDLTNLRRKNSPQLLDQSKQIHFNLCFISKSIFNKIKLKMAVNNMSYIHVSPDVLSALILCISVNYNNKFWMASPEAIVLGYSVKRCPKNFRRSYTERFEWYELYESYLVLKSLHTNLKR